MQSISERIQAAKDAVTIPELWDILRLPGEMPRGGTGLCRSPFRPDNKPSFSIYDAGRKWKDQSTGAGGDAVDFLAEAEGRDRPDAIKRFLEIAHFNLPLLRPHFHGKITVSKLPHKITAG